MDVVLQLMRGCLIIGYFQACIYNQNLLQVENCCRNFRLLVDEDDLECLTNQRKLQYNIVKQLMKILYLNPYVYEMKSV